jgi:hypothetical protein
LSPKAPKLPTSTPSSGSPFLPPRVLRRGVGVHLRDHRRNCRIVRFAGTQQRDFRDSVNLPGYRNFRNAPTACRRGEGIGLGLGPGGNQYDALSLTGIRNGDGGVVGLRPDLAGGFLGDGKRHHLAADLGKPLETTDDAHEPFGIDLDDVTGIIPAVGRCPQSAWLGGIDVPQHHVAAADLQRPPDPGRERE